MLFGDNKSLKYYGGWGDFCKLHFHTLPSVCLAQRRNSPECGWFTPSASPGLSPQVTTQLLSLQFIPLALCRHLPLSTDPIRGKTLQWFVTQHGTFRNVLSASAPGKDVSRSGKVTCLIIHRPEFHLIFDSGW